MPRRRSTGVRLYQRGRVWWTQYYDARNVRHDISTKCRDWDAALARAQQIERDAVNPGAAKQGAATVGVACGLYLENKQKLVAREKRSVESLEFFQTKITNVLRVLGPDRRLVDLLPAHLDAYVEAREQHKGARGEKSKVTAHTIKKELTAFRQALELAKREGLFAGEIVPLFPKDLTAEYVPVDRALDRGEVSRLVNALLPSPVGDAHRPRKDGDRAARIAFLVATAARWSGSERFTEEDFAYDLRWVRLRETKTKAADRIVPIVTPEQRALLEFALRHASGGAGDMFRPWDSVNRDFANACERAKIDRCSPNDLRRTMALWLRAAGASPDVVGTILGHTTSRMVELVYARLARRPEELRRLLQSQLRLDQDCSAIAAERTRSAAFDASGALAIASQVLDIQVTARKQGAL